MRSYPRSSKPTTSSTRLASDKYLDLENWSRPMQTPVLASSFKNSSSGLKSRCPIKSFSGFTPRSSKNCACSNAQVAFSVCVLTGAPVFVCALATARSTFSSAFVGPFRLLEPLIKPALIFVGLEASCTKDGGSLTPSETSCHHPVNKFVFA